jgi:cytochrome P450
VVTSNGKYWVQQRRLALPSLRKEHINDYSKVMVRRAEGLLKRWRGYASSGDVIDGENEMTQLTVGIAGETLLGEDLDSRSQEVGRLFINANRYIAARFVRPLSPWTIHLPRPLNWSYNVTLKKIDNLLYEIIARRRRQPTAAPKDLLGVFLAAKDEETGQPLTDAQVRDEAITYLFAGHETSSTALTWIWYLLALHPEVEAQLHAELDQTLGGRSPTIDDLPALTYTKRVFEEALRFYPPGYVMSRRALEDDELGGYFIPKGAQVFLSPYVTHHHPEFWDQPEKFDPDRFLPERSANRHRFAYIPFGFGPRRCIGDGFATAEVQLLLATMAQRYRCRMANKEPLEIIPLVTIRPSKGLPMTLQVRGAT